MFNRNILLLFLLFVPGLSCSLFAQIKNPGVISGRIMDKESLTPLEYANILLLDSIKGAMVTGVVSDSNGFFRMTNVPVGKFFLEYSYIGYEKKRTKSIVIDRKNFRKDLDHFFLNPRR